MNSETCATRIFATFRDAEKAIDPNWHWNGLAFSERFWSHVNRGGEDACWPWTGQLWKSNRYGKLRFRYAWLRAHRVAWILTHGHVPDGLCILHRCDNRSCVNPDHLFLGTYTDNARDMIKKRRGRGQFPAGESHPCAKLTKDNVREIRRLRALGGMTCQAIATRFGLKSRGQITLIAKKRIWAWVE